MICRLCGGAARLTAERRDVCLYVCARCGFVSGVPSADVEAEQRYDGYYEHRPIAPAPRARYQAWLARAERLIGRGHLLEVGAGAGGFVREALARGWAVDATEISRSALAPLQATGATIFAGDVIKAGYPDCAFDLVVSLEVLEHVAHPREHLNELARITRRGGLLILTTPNFGGLSRRFLGVRWRVIGAEHLGYFTPGTLRRALRDAGYAEARVSTRTLDIVSWRKGGGPDTVPRFDPIATARLRDRVEGSTLLRVAKDTVNASLALTGLGDSLMAWATR